ncbi:MAG: toll/interleukin-1 receptor domain-containing protein [Deltaproteobacteria bacterium]|nr:toll/interleukin-1 receptor domain-containing protein [Deltaproteobacteria bacterium]
MTDFAVFLTYAHQDDKGAGGKRPIKMLRDEVVQACRQRMGDKRFEIFMDTENIPLADVWRQRIDNTLNEAMLLLAVLTPSFFASEYCFTEVQVFMARERELGRKDLVLPIQWLDPSVVDPKGPFDEKILRSLFERQMMDFRHLRLYVPAYDGTNIELASAIDKLASGVVDVIKRTRNARRSVSKQSPRRDMLLHLMNLSHGVEQEPHLGIRVGETDDSTPRTVLEKAHRHKQEGRYEKALEVYEELLGGVEATSDIELFVDQMYFAISLYDKMERWAELRDLDERFLKKGLQDLKEQVLNPSELIKPELMRAASMSLVSFRQLNFAEGAYRIKLLSLEDIHSAERVTNILKANAYMALVLNLIGRIAFGRDAREMEQTIEEVEDHIQTAEQLYQSYAKLGTDEEFHHAGRFYGARAFAAVQWRRQGRPILDDEELIELSAKAHGGRKQKNRTRYGQLAGLYCEAFCRYEVSAGRPRQDNLSEAEKLLKDALDTLDKTVPNASVTRFRLAFLGMKVSKDGSEAQQRFDREQRRAVRQLNRDVSKPQFFTVKEDSLLCVPLN